MRTGREQHWMVCEVRDAGHVRTTPCLFDEDAGMRRGDPPRCIRHGALLFSDSTLNGMGRGDARAEIKRRDDAHRS